MACLTCKDLAVGYGGKAVLTSVSFAVRPGDGLCIIGENGAGKSTLVKTLLGLLPPLAGTVSLGCDGIGYLPQRSEVQGDFPASAWEVALSGRARCLRRWPFYSRADREATRSALGRVGALDLAEAPFGSLSGGQRQRVLLARALASDPGMLVLDEPATGLDPEAAGALYAELDRLRASRVALVSVTHDIAGALPHGTAVLVVKDGRARHLPVSAWEAEGTAAS